MSQESLEEIPTPRPVDIDPAAPSHAGKYEERLLALDGARLLASVAVIWLHVPKGPTLEATAASGRFAVPFFTQAAVLLAYAAPERRPRALWVYAVGRFRRIYMVFLVWSAFFGLTRYAAHFAMHQPDYQLRVVDLLWNGTALQLWFLPFILLASLLAFAVRRWSDWWAIGHRTLGIIALVIGAGCACWPAGGGLATGLGYTGILGWGALPSVWWAIGLAAVRRDTSRAIWGTPSAAVLGGILLAGGSVWAGMQIRQTLGENLAGMGLLLLVLNPRAGPWFQPVARWGFMAFGIYLIHPFWLEGLEDVQHKMLPGELPGFALAAFVFALFMSAASTALLWRIHALRWLVA